MSNPLTPERLKAIGEAYTPGTIEPTVARLISACTSGTPYLCGSCFACKASWLLREAFPDLLAEVKRLQTENAELRSKKDEGSNDG